MTYTYDEIRKQYLREKRILSKIDKKLKKIDELNNKVEKYLKDYFESSHICLNKTKTNF